VKENVRSIHPRTVAHAFAWALAFTACALAASAFATLVSADPAEGEALRPEWLRAPETRGPLAAAIGVDAQRAWWGIDGAVPLSFWLPRTRTNVANEPAFGLGLSVTGSATSDASNLHYSALIDRRTRLTGGWLGVATGGSGVQSSRFRVGTGLWRAVAPFEFEAGLVSGMEQGVTREVTHWTVAPDTFRSHDTTSVNDVDRLAFSTTAHSAIRWRFGRMELGAMGGLTLGPRNTPLRWAQATMHVQASPHVLVMAAYGQRPAASMAFEPAAGGYTMLGVRVAPWASHDWGVPHSTAPVAVRWRAQPLEDGGTVIRLRCHNASRVELAADFTDWAPVTLLSTGNDWWERSVTIPPGLHEVQVRLDGGVWQVPPGLPRTAREFAGDAGVLVIE
jgi:hypothetical protein